MYASTSTTSTARSSLHSIIAHQITLLWLCSIMHILVEQQSNWYDHDTSNFTVVPINVSHDWDCDSQIECLIMFDYVGKR